VTLTGGEVLAQPAFAAAVLAYCHENQLNTAIETCGYGPEEAFQEILAHTDLVLYDLKHMDPQRHLWGTGVDNVRILENLKLVSRLGLPVIVRTPLIPGYNDSEENITAMAAFITAYLPTCQEVNLLPYHKLGESKKEQLEETIDFTAVPPQPAEVEHLLGILRDKGIQAK